MSKALSEVDTTDQYGCPPLCVLTLGRNIAGLRNFIFKLHQLTFLWSTFLITHLYIRVIDSRWVGFVRLS